jgi:protein gp37
MNLDKNIGWCTHTENIMTGCLNKKRGICNVEACYAQQTAENPYYRKAFPYGFEPHFYPNRINDIAKLKKPAIIFMDSMSDIFGDWWHDDQILKVLHVMDNMRGVHWHKYVVLTKNPIRMVTALEDYAESDGVDRLNNVYFGTSVSGLGGERELNRLANLRVVHEIGYKTVLSIEPLIYDPEPIVKSAVGISWADWILIGGQTKPTKYPAGEWIYSILKESNVTTPVFIKDNTGCENLIPGHRKNFPADLLPVAQAWGKA